MLIAHYKEKLINAEFAQKQKKYTCPICHELVILKKGHKMVSHFAHYVSSDCVGNEGETQLHLKGKQHLLKDLIKEYPKIKLEIYLNDLKQRPDLLTGNLAFEYQCSPISNRRLKERVIGYQSRQINSIWILGMDYFRKNLHAYSVLRFIRYQKCVGFYLLFLDASQHQYCLKYQIYQIGNQIQCKLKIFDNYQMLIKFMKTPQQNTYLQPNLIKLTQSIETKVRWQDTAMIKLQKRCYENGHLLTGCPLIVYYPIQNSPILNRNWLEWKIEIILYLENKQECKLSDLYQLVNHEKFLFIKIKNPTLSFLKLLAKQQYVKIEGENIKLSQNFIWYRDTYDKIGAIKKLEKRHYYDS